MSAISQLQMILQSGYHLALRNRTRNWVDSDVFTQHLPARQLCGTSIDRGHFMLKGLGAIPSLCPFSPGHMFRQSIELFFERCVWGWRKPITGKQGEV
jgi:hypothetical protein